MIRKNLLIAGLALATLSSSPGGIPGYWNRARVESLFGNGDQDCHVEWRNGQLISVSFFKQAPHHFHGGECFMLVLATMRGPDHRITTNEKGVDGITVDDLGVWHDAITGIIIQAGGPDGFDFIASRDGKVLATARWIDHGQGFTEFKVEGH